MNGRAVPILAVLLAASAAALLLFGGPLRGSAFGLSGYLVNAAGQLACFAMLALALDLVWGFCGILSLGHGLYFAIGGYVVAMHLLKHSMAITGRVPDLVQFMGWSSFPFYWWGLEFFPYALALAAVVTLVIGLGFAAVAFRSRVSGVYLAIITQALVYVAMLLMFRNDTGFGGNNGMTGFSRVFGFDIAAPGTGLGLAVASVLALLAALLACQAMVRGRFGRLLIACRDDEVRLRTLGYDTLWLKLAAWGLSALLAALAGFLYVPQVGIVNPRVLSPELSLEIAVWVAIGGRGYLAGAVVGAVLVNALKFWLSTRAPDLWPFLLSGLVVLVVLVFPNGLLDLGKWRPRALRRAVP
jgi:urea transport system permease protein